MNIQELNIFEAQALKSELDKHIVSLMLSDKTSLEDKFKAIMPIIYSYIEFETDVTESEIKSSSRKRDVCIVREILANLLCKYYELTKVGKILGNRHHSTIINAKMRYNQDYEYDDDFKELADKINSKFDELIS